MKHLLMFVSMAVFAQQVDYNSQIKNKPSLTTINGGSLPATGSITKIDGSGHLTAAVAGTDYATPGSTTLPFLNAKSDCGLVMNGSTDDTSALNTCIGNLPAGGGQIRFPAGTAVIGNLTIQKDNVILVGAGAGTSVSTTTPATKFLYTGSAGGFVVKWYKASTMLHGGELRGIGIDAASSAANGLWLRNTDGFRGIDFAVFNHTGYGVIIDAASSIGGVCGDGSRANFLDNFSIWSSAGGGLQVGSTAYDVCSHKIGKGNITWSGLPGWHGIIIPHGDSNSFADVDIGEFSGKTVSSISCTSNVCTISATGHGQTVTDGVYLKGASNDALKGTFAATVTGSNSMTIPVTIANGSYTATSISGSSVQLGGVGCLSSATGGCAWNNSFGKLLTTTGVHQFQNSAFLLYPNHIAQWNWNEVSGGSIAYAKMGTVSGFGHDGSMFNQISRTDLKIYPPSPIQYGIQFLGTPIIDFGIGIDFANADPVTASAYYPMRIHNATVIAAVNAAKTQNIEVIGVDSDDSIRIGSAFNPAGTYVKVNSQFKFGSLAHPTCNASAKGVINYFANSGAADDTLRICIQLSGGSYAWKDLINP